MYQKSYWSIHRGIGTRSPFPFRLHQESAYIAITRSLMHLSSAHVGQMYLSYPDSEHMIVESTRIISTLVRSAGRTNNDDNNKGHPVYLANQYSHTLSFRRKWLYSNNIYRTSQCVKVYVECKPETENSSFSRLSCDFDLVVFVGID